MLGFRSLTYLSMLKFLFANAETVSVVHRLSGSFACFQLPENRPLTRSLEFGETYIVQRTLLGYEVFLPFEDVVLAYRLQPSIVPHRFRKFFEIEDSYRKRRMMRALTIKGKQVWRYV